MIVRTVVGKGRLRATLLGQLPITPTGPPADARRQTSKVTPWASGSFPE